MISRICVAIPLVLLSTLSPLMVSRASAQREASRGGGSVPTAGTMLPVVTAIDEQGEAFSTATLRGSYTVLVFGCLT